MNSYQVIGVVACVMTQVLCYGCDKRDQQPVPAVTIDPESAPRRQLPAHVELENKDAKAGDMLTVTGTFDATGIEERLPFVVIEIVREEADGKQSVWNSISGSAQKLEGNQYAYRVDLKGPQKGGKYQIRTRAGRYDAGTREVVIPGK